MKGAIVLVERSVPFLAALNEVRADLGLDLQHADDYSLQLSDPDGRLLTAFATAEPESEWVDALVADSGQGAQADRLTGHSVECRWEDLFCKVVEALAARVAAWVVDSDGVLWRGDSVEPGRLRL